MKAMLPTLALLLLPTPCGAQEDMEAAADRFSLFTRCSSVQLAVATLPDDATDTGLTRDGIQRTARSRLRAARIYHGDEVALGVPRLYIQVHVVGVAFSVRVVLSKAVYDPFSNLTLTGATWSRGSVGTHGGNAGYVRQVLSELMDLFIDEYLRVNAESCQ
ncbi:hypothetical protein [Candidatus Palauibacter sp.]|uniref:hypothetical protein n=1 Tax=Candidatus Palauibacter sp. TaxID=3101350 RepID=UPI003B51EF7A